MARACVFLVPGDWHTPTGGYRYDRRIADGLQATGWKIALLQLDDGFPSPTPGMLARADAALAALPDDTLVIADCLAFGAMPQVAERHARRLKFVALVHHPLWLETGLSEARQRELRDAERRALAAARRVIVTSETTAKGLAALEVPAHRIDVVEPGCDRPPPFERPSEDHGLQLLCVATLTPRKGHLALLQALAALRDRRWTLHCVGSLARDAATATQVRQALQQWDLSARVRLHGELDDDALERRYREAHVFVLPSLFEGYGMVFAEAMAHGLPIVACATGAVPQTVPADAGLLVPAGDAEALRDALARLLDDGALRQRLGAGALRAAARLPTWAEAAARFAAALDDVSAIQRDERRAAPKPARIPSGDRPAYSSDEGLSFSADWLALREPHDRAAREAPEVSAATAEWLSAWRDRAPQDQPLNVIDLACGTGANLRHWLPRLGGAQRWRVLDHDAALLATWPQALAEWARREGHVVEQRGDEIHVAGHHFTAVIERRHIDLAAGLDAVPWHGAALITASALLDLVSADWLQRLVEHCAAVGAAAAFALSVDGRLRWQPALPGDERVDHLFSQHQRRDKGFGAALGAEAPAQAARLLSRAGYSVRQARSDWQVQGDMLQALVHGMAGAAMEQEPGAQPALDDWRQRRLALAVTLTLEVGHVDLMAHPAAR